MNNYTEWLRKRFYYDNHPKYHKYFYEWLNNLTPSQATGFIKQFEHCLKMNYNL